MSIAEIRSGCSARRHGDACAYGRYRCRCDDAREDWRLYRKRGRENRLTPGWIDGLGAARKLRALAAIGWGVEELGPRLGWRKARVSDCRRQRNPRVTRRTAGIVDRVYDELSMTLGPDPLAASYAKRMGWPPPLAWDDIDDPSTQPHMGESAGSAIDLSEVDHLERGGCHISEIARRMGVSAESIRTARWRVQKTAGQREVA
jgi:hypothetical protein